MKTIRDKELFESTKSFLTNYMPLIRQKSKNTIKSYRDTINLFFRYLEIKNKTDIFGINISMINQESIIGFLNWIVEKRGCKATTRNQRLSCIRSFYTYLTTKDPCLMSSLSLINEIAKMPVVKDEIPKFLSEKEMSLVLSLPDIHTNLGLRDLTYLTLLYDSGARDNEIRSLKLQDMLLSSDDGKIHIVGKGSKVRLTPVSNCMTKLLKLYCEKYHENCSNANEFLFFTVHAGQHCKMSADNSARIMSKYEKIARETLPNIAHLHPHLFRHSRAMHLYQAGMPLVLVAEWLGHSQLETTLVYAHADTSMKRKAIEKAIEGNDIIASNEKPKYMDKEKTIKKLYGLI
jgi:site-specific recombinase XerD